MRYLSLENQLKFTEISKIELSARLENTENDLKTALRTLSDYDSLSANSSKQLEKPKNELRTNDEERKEATKR